jgi:hypothetical protein
LRPGEKLAATDLSPHGEDLTPKSEMNSTCIHTLAG